MSNSKGVNLKSGDKDEFFWHVSKVVDKELEGFFIKFSKLSDFQKENIESALKLRLFEQPVHQSVVEKVAQNTAIQHWSDMGKLSDLMKSIPAEKFLGSDEATTESLHELKARTNIDLYLDGIDISVSPGVEENRFNCRHVMRAAINQLLRYCDECKKNSDMYESGAISKPPIRKGNPPKGRTAVLELCSDALFQHMHNGCYKIEDIAELLSKLFSAVDGLGKAEFSKDLKNIKTFYERSEFKGPPEAMDYLVAKIEK